MTENMIVDLQDGELKERFTTATVWQKKAVVDARQVTETEFLDTILANGFLETSREVPPGHWIITNPGGEQYAVSDEKFRARYTSIGGGKFKAKGFIRAYPNPTGRSVEITAPWGEKQFGDAECLFASALDIHHAPTDDCYIIGREEFEETYEQAAVFNQFITTMRVEIQRPKQDAEK